MGAGYVVLREKGAVLAPELVRFDQMTGKQIANELREIGSDDVEDLTDYDVVFMPSESKAAVFISEYRASFARFKRRPAPTYRPAHILSFPFNQMVLISMGFKKQTFRETNPRLRKLRPGDQINFMNHQSRPETVIQAKVTEIVEHEDGELLEIKFETL